MLVKAFSVALVGALVAPPTNAESPPPMAPREAIAVMPSGKLARVVVTDDKVLADLLSEAKPIPWCAMLLLAEDGKVYLVNTDFHDPMVACENMVD